VNDKVYKILETTDIIRPGDEIFRGDNCKFGWDVIENRYTTGGNFTPCEEECIRRPISVDHPADLQVLNDILRRNLDSLAASHGTLFYGNQKLIQENAELVRLSRLNEKQVHQLRSVEAENARLSSIIKDEGYWIHLGPPGALRAGALAKMKDLEVLNDMGNYHGGAQSIMWGRPVTDLPKLYSDAFAEVERLKGAGNRLEMENETLRDNVGRLEGIEIRLREKLEKAFTKFLNE